MNTTKRKKATDANRTRTYAEIFCANSKVSRHLVKKRLIVDKLISYECNECGLTNTWHNKQLCLQIEHKNGIRNDNQIENLCFLCPNCHSQTPTFCGRNKTHVVNRSREQFNTQLREQLRVKHQPDVDTVLNSKINFQMYGWSVQVSKLLNKNPQKIKDWMMRYMPDFYKGCYHRKFPNK